MIKENNVPHLKASTLMWLAFENTTKAAINSKVGSYDFSTSAVTDAHFAGDGKMQTDAGAGDKILTFSPAMSFTDEKLLYMARITDDAGTAADPKFATTDFNFTTFTSATIEIKLLPTGIDIVISYDNPAKNILHTDTQVPAQGIKNAVVAFIREETSCRVCVYDIDASQLFEYDFEMDSHVWGNSIINSFGFVENFMVIQLPEAYDMDVIKQMIKYSAHNKMAINLFN